MVLLEAKLNLVNSILLEEFGIVVITQRAFLDSSVCLNPAKDKNYCYISHNLAIESLNNHGKVYNFFLGYCFIPILN